MAVYTGARKCQEWALQRSALLQLVARASTQLLTTPLLSICCCAKKSGKSAESKIGFFFFFLAHTFLSVVLVFGSWLLCHITVILKKLDHHDGETVV